MDQYTYDLSSAFISGSGTILLPGGGTVTIGGGSGYPTGGGTSYPYYGQPGTGVGSTMSGWIWIVALIVVAMALFALMR